MNRRTFLKTLGGGVAATAIAACTDGNGGKVTPEGSATGEVPTDKMTYRTNTKTRDKVSILGYGCMRWPMRQKSDGSGEEIDQDAVNELVDYALAHGVNYFDTAPTYGRDMSETDSGRRESALSLQRRKQNLLIKK